MAGLIALTGLFVLARGQLGAQELSSKLGNNSGTANGPIAALRDALAAACSQSQDDFSHLLTERNKESFSRLTPAARVALMKRFVLLNEPGKPSVTVNAAGRPTVRCETPAGAVDMQIGGADVRDNVAFLPLKLRDATDTTGEDVHRATMGMVREGGSWKLLSLGLLLLDLPALEIEWDIEQVDTNEKAAIENIERIAAAVETYRRKYTRLPVSIADLGPPLHGEATAEAAGLLDSELATGIKDGYSFRYVILGGSALGAPAKFELAATPLTYGRTGRRSFFLDARGELHGADRQGALGSENDPKVQ